MAEELRGVIGFDEESMGPELIRMGWRPPAGLVTDPAGLDELPDGSVVADAGGRVRQLVGDRWATAGVESLIGAEAIPLPATVLVVPGEVPARREPGHCASAARE